MDEQQSKRNKKLDPSEYIICSQKLTKSDSVIQSPSIRGLETIFEAAEVHVDDAHIRLSHYKEDILPFKFKVRIPKSCRAAYTSKSNLSWQEGKRCHENDAINKEETCQSKDPLERIHISLTLESTALYVDVQVRDHMILHRYILVLVSVLEERYQRLLKKGMMKKSS